jgi:hypothetical protein
MVTIEIEQRLARAEETAARALRDVAALQARFGRPSGRIRSFVAGALFAMAGSYLATTLGAQAPKKTATEFKTPFYVTNSSNKSVLSVTEGGIVVTGDFHVARSNGAIFASLTSDPTVSGLSISSSVSVPTGNGPTVVGSNLVFLGIRKMRGYMELADESGNKMVEAGSLDDHKGYVLASPYRSSVGPNGNPSVLMGGAGR